MAEIRPFPARRDDRSGGGGPEDPTLEQRVARLEETLDRIDRRLSTIEKDLSVLPKMTDHAALKADVAELKGRFSGLDHRLSALPTVWTILTITFTTWAQGSGILIAALKNLR